MSHPGVLDTPGIFFSSLRVSTFDGGRFTQNPNEEPGSTLQGRADGLLWTSGETIPAGTIVTTTITDLGGLNADTATWSIGSSSGDFGTTGLSGISGESLFAYQGLDTNPNFIFDLRYGSSSGDTWATSEPAQYSTNPSNLPAVLNTPTGSLFVQAENGYYSGSMSDQAAIADYRARVLSLANWTTSNDDISNLGAQFPSSTFSTVPEPSTAFAALGGAALMLYRRRRG